MPEPTTHIAVTVTVTLTTEDISAINDALFFRAKNLIKNYDTERANNNFLLVEMLQRETEKARKAISQ